MRLSIEVGHPAHVHYWRPVYKALLAEGHDVAVFARGKETTFALLRALRIPFIPVGRNFPTVAGKAVGMAYNTLDVLRESRRLHIQLMLSGGMPYSAQASAILGVPHLAIIDTENAALTLGVTIPFTDVVCTPACFRKSFKNTVHVRFDGYVESMYLRPEYFTLSTGIREELGLRPGQPFSVVRFSSWDSSHDLFRVRTGLETSAGKDLLIRSLAKYGPVFASSEVPLPSSLLKSVREIPLDDVHSLLHYASVYCGEGAKMAAESGLLGTPWIYVSPIGRSYLDEQENRFALGRSTSSLEDAINQAEAWLGDPNLKEKWQVRRKQLLDETSDVTLFVMRQIHDLMGGFD